MQGSVLEVLLVSAKGLRHSSSTLLGHPSYYVVLQCGKETRKSKITQGEGRKAWWNEKIIFKFPFSDMQDTAHLSLRIMAKHPITNDSFFGESIIHLGGVLTEGSQKGQIELKPAPYNIVREDKTYKGEIKIGIKFIANIDLEVQQGEIKETSIEEKKLRSLYTTIFSLIRAPWLRLSRANPVARKKQN